jgi:hypothetical protein
MKMRDGLQLVISQVPAGKMIIYCYGESYRVFLDSPEDLVEMRQEWVDSHRGALKKTSQAASRTLSQFGLDVQVYG